MQKRDKSWRDYRGEDINVSQLNKPMSGKICLVTGATSGIGMTTAQALAQRGATVIVVGRSPEKSMATVDRIKRETGNSAVEFMLADLSSQQEIRQLARQFKNQNSQLHVLVNNAAALFMSRRESVDGIEMTFAVNHLAYFLLTNLLLDTLKASTQARIINVSAIVHKRAKIDFNNLQNQKHYVGWQAYNQSKLANVLFSYELARRLVGTGVTVNALQPETVAIVRMLQRLTWVPRSWVSPEQGAQTITYLATSPQVEGVSGKYFANQKAIESSQASYDQAAARQLWQVSAQLTGMSA